MHVIQESLQREHSNAIPCLSEQESQLLQNINIGLPQETWQRYRELVSRRRNEELTAEEQNEAIQISDQLEQRNAQRLVWLGELARLRNLPLRALMKQLGMTPTDV